MTEMRSMDKIKEKIVIRLDSREIAWLVIGCLIISSGVFAMGYFVATSNQPAMRSGTMAVLPGVIKKAVKEKSSVDDALADLQYTYDQELTTPTPPEKINDSALEIIAKFKDQIQPSVHSEDVTGPDLALAGPRPVNHANSALEGEKFQIDAKTGRKLAGMKPVKGVASDTPAWAVTPNRPNAGTKGNAPHSSAAQKASGYTIQIRAFKNQVDAKSFSKVLHQAGYKPYVVAAEISGKGTFYRVRLGKFKTLAAATTTQARFEQAESYSTIVTPL